MLMRKKLIVLVYILSSFLFSCSFHPVAKEIQNMDNPKSAAVSQDALEENTPKPDGTEREHLYENTRPFIVLVETLEDDVTVEIALNRKIEKEGGADINYSLDCDNDGIYEKISQDEDIHCEYSAKGQHVINIKSDSLALHLCKREMVLSSYHMIDIKQWGDISWRTMEYFAKDCKKIQISARDAPDLSNVRSMKGMFFVAEFAH